MSMYIIMRFQRWVDNGQVHYKVFLAAGRQQPEYIIMSTYIVMWHA